MFMSTKCEVKAKEMFLMTLVMLVALVISSLISRAHLALIFLCRSIFFLLCIYIFFFLLNLKYCSFYYFLLKLSACCSKLSNIL